MAGTSGRFTTVIKAKINRLLDKAEDPGETLDGWRFFADRAQGVVR